jgi:hypothetical protein
MRLFEIDNTITFRSEFVNPVTEEFTKEFLDAGLYVDSDSRAFKKWWVNPRKYFHDGGVFSLAYKDKKLIGIGVISIQKFNRNTHMGWVYEKPETTYKIIGWTGLFVQKQYRRTGIANTLTQTLEEAFLKSFPRYNADEYTPVVRCSRQACNIVNAQFKKIISDQEMYRRFKN